MARIVQDSFVVGKTVDVGVFDEFDVKPVDGKVVDVEKIGEEIVPSKSEEIVAEYPTMSRLYINFCNYLNLLSHRRSQDFWFRGPKPQISCNDVIKIFQKK